TGNTYIGEEIPAELLSDHWEGRTRFFNVIFSPLKRLDRSIESVMIFALEVTEQVLARKQIEDAESRLKLALTSAQMGAWNVKFPEQTVEMDEVGFGIFGGKPSDFDGKLQTLYTRVHAEDAKFVNENLQASIESNELVNRSYRITWPDGSIHWIQSQGKIFRHSSGEISHITGTVFDATQKRRSEEQLKEALAARDEFLSIASHELKTPITSLKLQIQMTQKGFDVGVGQAPPREKITKVLNLADRQINRLEHLLEDLLDVAKIRAGKLTFKFEPVRLNLVIEEVLDRLEVELKAAGCEISLQLDHRIEGLWDRGRIEQIVINLISNAIKYAPRSRIDIRTEVDQASAQIEIADHGQGIAKDKQALIFERFERVTASRNIT
ncbi:MAG: hypothetical protein EOP09_17275, partial [Proteobacteria bacterium]